MNISRYAFPMAVGATLLLGSCADDLLKEIKVDKPQSVIEDEKYRDLLPIKDYIGSDANLKISGTVPAGEFINGGIPQAIAVNNFTELTAVDAVTYGSLVKDDGTTDYSKIVALANSASKYGLSVFGSTLVCQDNQNPTYLGSLFAEEVIKTVVDGGDEPSGPKRVDSDNGLVSVQPLGEDGKPAWYQYFVADQIPTEVGKTYSIIVEIKGKDGEGKFNANMGWGWGEGQSTSTEVSFTKEWTTGTFDFAGPVDAESCNVVFQPGGMSTVFYVRGIKVVEKGTSEPVIFSNDFTTFTSFPYYVMGYTPEFNYEEVEETSAPKPSAVADVVKTEEGHCLVVHSGDMEDQPWDTQFWIVTDGYAEGASYEFSMKIRATHAASAGSQIHNEPGGYVHWAAVGTPNFTEEWKTYTATGKFDKAGQSIAFNLNDDKDANDYYFDNISLKVDGVELITNGDLEGPETKCFVKKEKRGDIVECTIEGDACIIVHTDDMVDQPWDSQFWIVTDAGYAEGASYEFSMMIRADHAASAGSQIHEEPGAYVHWAAVGTPNFTEEWKKYTATGKFDKAGKSIAFNLNDDKTANNYYFKDFSLKVDGTELIVNGDLKSDDTHCFVRKEKRGDIVVAPKAAVYSYMIPGTGDNVVITYKRKNIQAVLDKEMRRFISEIMDATNGKVTAWDVVAEPISDGSVVLDDGFYGLQHEDKTNADRKYTNPFFWQDYMGDTITSKAPTARKKGDTLYVRTAVGAARRYFKGDKAQLKLFVNEYGLEKDEKKLKSLLHWVSVWECDTVKIDGFSVQIAVDADNKSVEIANVEKMLSSLSETGRLVRIAGIDVTGSDSDDIAAAYKAIVKAYIDKVPSTQRYGINLSNLTDGSVYGGLWTEEYKRNASYRGFVEGLSGN